MIAHPEKERRLGDLEFRLTASYDKLKAEMACLAFDTKRKAVPEMRAYVDRVWDEAYRAGVVAGMKAALKKDRRAAKAAIRRRLSSALFFCIFFGNISYFLHNA